MTKTKCKIKPTVILTDQLEVLKRNFEKIIIVGVHKNFKIAYLPIHKKKIPIYKYTFLQQ